MEVPGKQQNCYWLNRSLNSAFLRNLGGSYWKKEGDEKDRKTEKVEKGGQQEKREHHKIDYFT